MPKNDLILEFKNPIKFEGKEYKKIDLTELENLTTKDLLEVEKQFSMEGNFAAQPESSVAYARLISERVTEHPLEFFDQLNAKAMIKVKNAVMNFFYGEE